MLLLVCLSTQAHVCLPGCVCWRGKGTLIFSFIRRLRPFFGVKIFDFQYFFRLSEK